MYDLGFILHAHQPVNTTPRHGWYKSAVATANTKQTPQLNIIQKHRIVTLIETFLTHMGIRDLSILTMTLRVVYGHSGRLF